jgi:MoaA/NifB/PqqE/SkfB family radical SAM enzyme
MAGDIPGAWDKVVRAIRHLSAKTYVTVGMVFTEQTVDRCIQDVLFAHDLGVSDIRVIPAAQYNKALTVLADLPEHVLNKYPILKYRIDNISNGSHVRGLQDGDARTCWLALDDMVSAGGYHFPCVIHMREGGDPIGKIKDDIRQDRLNWLINHDAHTDPICNGMCLDVCVAYNNKAGTTHTIVGTEDAAA